MAVFMSGSHRGNAALAQRTDLLSVFVAEGVVEKRPKVKVPQRDTVQYVARRKGGEWRLFDGKELVPWLLGLAEGIGGAKGERLLAVMAEALAGADEVPEKALVDGPEPS